MDTSCNGEAEEESKVEDENMEEVRIRKMDADEVEICEMIMGATNQVNVM